MPGRVLMPQLASREGSSPGAASTMGVFKLTFPSGPQEGSPTAKSTPFHSSVTSMGRRFNTKVQPTKGSSLESPELEHFATSVGTISEDDSSVFTGSTRTSNTISDDDISLAEFAVRSSADYTPARHSTACCTDLAFRRELRKKMHVEPALDEGNASGDSFAMGHSFRRELEKEDRVESLALWEETEMPASTHRDRAVSKDMPHSWHGDTASSMSSRNRGLEAFFRKPKKASFFNGFFSGLTFSTSRRSRKS